MKIEKLKKLKNNKYKILLDNGDSIVTYDEVIINNMLFDGKNLDTKLLSEISINNDYYDVYYKVVKMISTRFRSEHEIIDYLNKNEVSKNVQNKVLTNLKNNGLINDSNFAKYYANDAIHLKKNGPVKIEDDLRKLGIKDSIISEVIKNLDYEVIHDNLISIVDKKNRLNKSNSLYVLKNKLTQELLKLGYRSDDIKSALNKLKTDDSIYKREYERLMKKYSKKYSGNELKYKVKQALYQKGFSYQDE